MNSLNEYDTIEHDFDYYGPAHTVTIGWLMVATNTMTYRLISSDCRIGYRIDCRIE